MGGREYVELRPEGDQVEKDTDDETLAEGGEGVLRRLQERLEGSDEQEEQAPALTHSLAHSLAARSLFSSCAWALASRVLATFFWWSWTKSNS